MPPSDIDLVRALEERSFNAWPARQTVLHDGWIFRLSGGFTKRANSANALVPGASFAGQRAAAEAFYARHGLGTVFRLSPLAAPHADRELEAAGYRHIDPSLVLRAPLHRAAAHPDMDIASTPSNDWLHGTTAANDVAAHHLGLHRALVQAIALPTGFATLRVQGQPVAFGLAVLDRGAIGLYDLVVSPLHRGRGHGRSLVQAFLHWGQQVGADSAYLQVSEQNTAARALYAALGFTRCYGYHYRLRDAHA